MFLLHGERIRTITSTPLSDHTNTIPQIYVIACMQRSEIQEKQSVTASNPCVTLNFTQATNDDLCLKIGINFIFWCLWGW